MGLSVRARAAFVVAVLLAATAAVLVTLDLARSDEPSYCVRNAAASAERRGAATGNGSRVVVVGDSWSAGWGLADPTSSWPAVLTGEVRVDGFSGSGFSVGASACPGVAYADRAARAVAGGADLVVVQGGLNDTDQPPADVREGVRLVLERLRGHDVVIVGPASAPWAGEDAARVDALLAEEAGRAGVRYVSTLDLELDYLDDGLHLTVEGHRAFGRAVAERLAAGSASAA